MKIFILFYFLLFTSLNASDFNIIANKLFPLKSLSAKQLKNIYLKKITYIDGIKIFAINVSTPETVRTSFEQIILSMNKKDIKMYWRKAHYQGIRPPKVLKSSKSVLSYISSIDGAIAYVPKKYPMQSLKQIRLTQ